MSTTEPRPFETLPERMRVKIDRAGPGGCWLWTGYVQKNGYGKVSEKDSSLLAHRAIYTLLVGPIPEGMTIDHVKARGCVHKHCVNPAHLEAVTNLENMRRRSSYGSTHCINGHERTATSTYPGNGRCRVCAQASALARYHAQRRKSA